MNLFDASLLGAVQGLTEFLPVSSSGHLVILQSIIPNFSQPGVLFDVFLHLGTSLAVIFYFWKKIIKISFKELFLLGVATIPAAIVGFLLSDAVDVIFKSVQLVSLALLVSGIMNIRTDVNKEKKDSFNLKEALIVGVFQAFAILPGISRSGSTIFSGTFLGIKKEKAAEFSFLLSVPAIMGAALLEILKYKDSFALNANYFVGFLFSFLFGLVCIKILLKALATAKFKYFGYYCLIVGVLSFILF